MQTAEFPLKIPILMSLLIHIGLMAGFSYLNEPKTRTVEIKLSFGTGDSAGGSLKGQYQAPKLVKLAKPAPIKQTITQPVVKTTSHSTTTPVTASIASAPSAAASGSSTGTDFGSGTGTGTTSGSGAGFNDPKAKYRVQIFQLVNSMKNYPRKAQALQQEGTVVVKIKLDKRGKLLQVDLVEKSDYQILTKATLDAIKGIKKFPAIPDELGMEEITFSIPFEYKIVDGEVI